MRPARVKPKGTNRLTLKDVVRLKRYNNLCRELQVLTADFLENQRALRAGEPGAREKDTGIRLKIDKLSAKLEKYFGDMLHPQTPKTL
jgi:hypothetical protein